MSLLPKDCLSPSAVLEGGDRLETARLGPLLLPSSCHSALFNAQYLSQVLPSMQARDQILSYGEPNVLNGVVTPPHPF